MQKVVSCARPDSRALVVLPHAQLYGLYFSASWSPVCQEFTSILSQGYKRVREKHGKRALEIVLVPVDTHEQEWADYAEIMPWFSLPFSERDAVVRLFLHFRVQVAPTLLIIDQEGEVVCDNARGRGFFGFGCDPLLAYQNLLELQQELED